MEATISYEAWVIFQLSVRSLYPRKLESCIYAQKLWAYLNKAVIKHVYLRDIKYIGHRRKVAVINLLRTDTWSTRRKNKTKRRKKKEREPWEGRCEIVRDYISYRVGRKFNRSECFQEMPACPSGSGK
jgi:hypothetical protein